MDKIGATRGISGAAKTRESAGPRYRKSQHTKLQKKQKLTSRQNLLAAARHLFTEVSYAATTVDDIVRRARVSRATFYRHFDSKTAVATALFDEVAISIDAAHDEFAAGGSYRTTDIAAWLNRIIDLLSGHRPLVQTMREVDVIDPKFDSVVDTTHDTLIARFGRRIPAFAAATSEHNEEARVRAHLLLLQFDQFCYAVVVRQHLDRSLAVKVMAEQFLRFIGPP
ncbi:MAG TPA: helix-turn-helix domain-containing protein [Alphaproteobacteria bacterium]|jgi:AcrR family transcriptional regulator|nr:helix-turn-helix domain-containing protein [Alphaproteobacteria bacterium]